MAADERCREARELMPELALGIADGEERARVLEHVAVCAGCQHELSELTAVADSLLQHSPEHEPPAGFELRVLDALHPPAPRPRRTLVRALAVAAAVVAASAITAGGLLHAFSDERSLAGRYRQTLAQAHGSYFGASRLHDASGAEAGVVFVYRGSPSWLVVTVDAGHRDAVRRAEVVGADGTRTPIPRFDPAAGTWGGELPRRVSAVSAVHLVDAAGRPVLVAEWPPGDDG
jgi:hypothetical protein